MTAPEDHFPPEDCTDSMRGKHTPGPWELSGDGIFAVSVLNARVRLADIVFHNRLNRIDAKANGLLIAAAPDYAAAVEQMLAHEQSGGDGWWKGFEMLKAAHAKAMGSSPLPYGPAERRT